MPRTNATKENPSDGMTWGARRLSLPLPDLPVIALKREEAIQQGYLPFAGFFLPHEYVMLPNFIKDLEAAGREYCIVRDLRHAKGIEVFAKHGHTDKIVTESPEAVQTTEAAQQMVSHRNATAGPRAAEGEQEAGDTESSVRETETNLASRASNVRSGDCGAVLESVKSVTPPPESEKRGDAQPN